MRGVLPLVALLLAGCSTPTGTPGVGEEDEPAALLAPWWNIGESWTIQFELGSAAPRTTKLVNFANNTFHDLSHFWLGVSDRQEALDHVFFDSDPFLGRIHWEILAPHEKGMHSAMFQWPLEDGSSWVSPILLGKEDLLVTASRNADGTFAVSGEARGDGASVEYDYDPSVRWFRRMEIVDENGANHLRAEVVEHQASGEMGTFYFLRGRDYLDADGGATGETETFDVKEEGATSIAFLLAVRTTTPATIEFLDPSGTVVHRETLALGGTANKIVEIKEHPTPGQWTLRYIGNVQGTILVRGIVEYKATL